MTFCGFSTNGLIGLPPEFFTEILPAITLASELKVTLHMFYLLSRQNRLPRRISWDDLVADRELRSGLQAISKVRSPEDMLAEGVDAAVQRATILHVGEPGSGRVINWYLVHTNANREWIEEARISNKILFKDEPPEEIQRPSLLNLYEQNIGILTPLLIHELREAEERYSYEWIEAALREAVRSNVRSWRYVCKVLENWETHGRKDAPDYISRHRPIDVEKYKQGAFSALFHHNNGGNGA